MTQKFSTRPLYKFIVNPGCVDQRMVDLWNAKLPLKIQIFMWMLWHDRLQTADQLKTRNWDGPKECKLCREQEDANHIMFRCPLDTSLWCWIRYSLGWGKIPVNLADFMDRGLNEENKKNHERMIFLLAGVCWASWRARNLWLWLPRGPFCQSQI